MPFTASQVWRAAKPIGAAASRIAGAALLAYAFILVLITASLQMSVTERLANLQPALDYNSGYSLWQDAVSNRRALTTLRKVEPGLLNVIAVAARKERDAWEEWNSAIEPIMALQRRLASIPGCELKDLPKNVGVTANTIIAELRSCDAEGNLSVSQRLSAREMIAKGASISQMQREFTNAIEERQRAERHHDEMTKSISRLSKSTQARADATMAFRELNSFTHGRLFGSGLLGDFPPQMHIGIDKAGRDIDGVGNVVTAQNGESVLIIIEIAIIKGHGDEALGAAFGPQRVWHFVRGNKFIVIVL